MDRLPHHNFIVQVEIQARSYDEAWTICRAYLPERLLSKCEVFGPDLPQDADDYQLGHCITDLVRLSQMVDGLVDKQPMCQRPGEVKDSIKLALADIRRHAAASTH